MSYISKYTGLQIDDRLDWAEEANSWGNHRNEGYLTEIPTATAVETGGIKVGDNLSVDVNGVLHASTESISSTDDLVEGITNLYFTPERVESALPIATAIEPGIVQIGDGLSVDAQGVLTADAQTGTTISSTDDLAEGVSNLYFTYGRVTNVTESEGYIKPDLNGEISISSINLPTLDDYKVDGIGLSNFTGGDSLPAQTGQGGNTLTTNGTSASWDVLDALTVAFTPLDYSPIEPTLKGHLEGLQAYVKDMIQAVNEGTIPASLEILSSTDPVETETYALEVRVISSVGLRVTDPVEYSLDGFNLDINPMTFSSTIDGWDHYTATVNINLGENTIEARATTEQNIETIESINVTRVEPSIVISNHKLQEDGGPYVDTEGGDSYTFDVTAPTFVLGGGPGGQNSQSFDGLSIDDRLIKPYTADDVLTVASQRTIMLCVKSGTLTDTRVAYGMRCDDVSNDDHIWVGSDALGHLKISISGGVNSQSLEGTSVITDNVWHHIGLVYDGTIDEVRLVVDGVTEATAPFTTSADWPATTTRPKEIGSFFEDYPWPGEICEVAEYNTALTDVEIGQIADSLGIGTVQTTGWTDFSEYSTTGYLRTNADWGELDSSSSAPFWVKNITGVGNVVERTAPEGTNASNAVNYYTPMPDATDMEVVVKCRNQTAGAHNWGVAIRTNSGTGTASYTGGLRNNTTDVRFGSIASLYSDLISLAIGDRGTVDSTLWFWNRTRIEGNTLYIKLWQDGDPEPTAWTLTHTDTANTITSVGKAGLFMRQSTHDNYCQWAYFGWATDGATAPLPA